MSSNVVPQAARSVKAPPAPFMKGATGRRRPERKRDVAPSLIPLLRSQPAGRYAEDREDAGDPLGAFKAVLLVLAQTTPL